MTQIPGHRRNPNLIKDWQPEFNAAVRELYRVGLDAIAEEAERRGHVWPMTRPRRLGELMPAVIARVHAARFSNHPKGSTYP